MRHKYTTTGLILSRTPIAEASVLVTILTPDLGLVRARAQSARASGAKLAAALQTLAESDIILVRGKEGWRLSGAVLGKNWFQEIQSGTARTRIGRTIGLLLRMVHGESLDPLFYTLTMAFVAVLADQPDESLQDAIECLAVLRYLRLLGLEAGEIPGGLSVDFSEPILQEIIDHRADYILRINRGIAASGL